MAHDPVPCLDCPYGGMTEPGVRHVRCLRCRADHARGKAADAAWDRRAREREARMRRTGRKWPDMRVRPRERTPSWDRYGRVVKEPPALTAADLAELRRALDGLDKATAAVRAALRGRL